MEVGNHIIQIKPWDQDDLDLLFSINSPEMTQHLGGPESKEKILKRHKRYLELGNKGRMFSIILLPDLESVGSVGYWQTTWNNKRVYEIGWSILTSYQGRGIATKSAKLAIEEASSENRYEYIHAFPSINNLASNAVCRRLGFQFISECEFEYPLGSFKRCNNWRYNLIER